MTHQEMYELYELYALGVLEEPAHSEIHKHIEEGCEYCTSQVHSAVKTTSYLAGLAEDTKAPRNLRRRVLASVHPVSAPARSWTFALGGLGAWCLVLLGVALWSSNQAQRMRSTVDALTSQRDDLRGRLSTLNSERTELLRRAQEMHAMVDALTSQRNDLRAQVQILVAERGWLRNQRGELQTVVNVVANAGTRTLPFGATNDVPHGRVFLSPTGRVVFVGLQLPQLAPDRTFQLWLVPANGAPHSAGIFRPNALGEAIYSSPALAANSNAAAVAVSVEPRQGSPAPTTKPVIVVP